MNFHLNAPENRNSVTMSTREHELPFENRNPVTMKKWIIRSFFNKQ